MYELSADITCWFAQKKDVCIATVIDTWGTSPRPVGTKMAFTADPFIAGSVSAGCVEGAVIEAGFQVLRTNRPELLHFGVSDEAAFNVGLTCGGKIEVFIRRLDYALFKALSQAISTHEPVALLTILEKEYELFGREILVSEGKILSGTFGKDLDSFALELACNAIASQQAQSATLENPGLMPLRVFVDVINPPPVLIIVGGGHIAITLVTLAKALGFQTVVIDPRKAFANMQRFPEADQLIQEWPDEAFKKINLNSASNIAIVTHDPKIDDPALKIVLNSPAAYIGVLGSRKTHAERCERLLADGIMPEQLARLHAPIGIDLASKNPQDIALSILAEIVKEQNLRKKSLWQDTLPCV